MGSLSSKKTVGDVVVTRLGNEVLLDLDRFAGGGKRERELALELRLPGFLSTVKEYSRSCITQRAK